VKGKKERKKEKKVRENHRAQ